MFTIKHVFRPYGQKFDSISLYEGRFPHLEPKQSDPTISQVVFTSDEGTICSIDSGIVYVMNSAGKTVETFRLQRSDDL